MKQFLRYLAKYMSYGAIFIAALMVALAVTGLIFFENDHYLLETLMIFGLLCSCVTIVGIVWFSYNMILKNAEDYPFDNSVIGFTFSTPSRNSHLFHKGVNCLHENDFNGALEIFSYLQDIKLKDDWKAVLCYFHGRTYQQMGYPTNAVKYYTKSIELGIGKSDIYIMAGRCYTYTGCYYEAIDVYKSLLKKGTDIDFVLTDMGLTYLKANMTDEALEIFERSVKEGQNYAFALGGCSLACLQLKDIDKSREYYSKALINNMDDVVGFKRYYCKIAEAAGILDKIDDNMRVNINDDEEDDM